MSPKIESPHDCFHYFGLSDIGNRRPNEFEDGSDADRNHAFVVTPGFPLDCQIPGGAADGVTVAFFVSTRRQSD